MDLGPGQYGWIITGSGDQNVRRNGALFVTPADLGAIDESRSEEKAPSIRWFPRDFPYPGAIFCSGRPLCLPWVATGGYPYKIIG